MLIFRTRNICFVYSLSRLSTYPSLLLPGPRSSGLLVVLLLDIPKRKTKYIGSDLRPFRSLDLYVYPCLFFRNRFWTTEIVCLFHSPPDGSFL